MASPRQHDGEIGRAANRPTGGDVQMTRSLSRAIVALVACCSTALLVASAARASDFSAEYVFGDSLSDNGNLAQVGPSIGISFTDPPSFDGSFTNGPVAVQLLAESLGLSANAALWLTAPAVPAGTNYAVAGATSATPSATGINLLDQVGAYNAYSGDHADPNGLYVVMIGGNDVRDAALDGTGEAAVAAGVADELTAISTLSGEGAKHFLVVNVPNVGIIPEFAQDNPSLAAEATTFSQDYDSALAAGLAGIDLGSDATLTDFDLYDYNANILANAASLGFTDTTDRCYTDTPGSTATSPQCGANAENIDSFLYWDAIHPTARVQALWAEGFEAAVPEPSTWAMLLIGLGGLGFAGYRARTRATP
jgi:phospholipase/lecithinase/hemolysin